FIEDSSGPRAARTLDDRYGQANAKVATTGTTTTSMMIRRSRSADAIGPCSFQYALTWQGRRQTSGVQYDLIPNQLPERHTDAIRANCPAASGRWSTWLLPGWSISGPR